MTNRIRGVAKFTGENNRCTGSQTKAWTIEASGFTSWLFLNALIAPGSKVVVQGLRLSCQVRVGRHEVITCADVDFGFV